MEVPEQLKAIAPYVKIANEYKARDPVIYYWTLFYAVQQSMQIDKDSVEAKTFLVSALDTLENVKKENSQNESLSQDVVAQAHIEAQASKLFNFADKSDRDGVFNKNVVKAFYAAGTLFDVLTLFGQLDENIASARKYARWKATYIHGCLKRGEAPVPGPPTKDGEDADIAQAFEQLDMHNQSGKPQPPPRTTPPDAQPSTQDGSINMGWNQPARPPPPPQFGQAPDPNSFAQTQQGYGAHGYGQPGFGGQSGFGGFPQAGFPSYPTQPGVRPTVSAGFSFPDPDSIPNPPPSVTQAHQPDVVSLEEYIEARRLCKMASSALDYEDAKTAIDFLEKALRVLKK